MQGEAARGWDLDPRRAPEPPVTTRRIHSDAPDPGAAGVQLPPFRSGSTMDDLGGEPVADLEEPRDALGEALQEAVTRAAPPFAEDLVRSAEWTDPTGIEEPPAVAPPPDSSAQRAGVGRVDAEVTGVRRRPSPTKPSADGFTEDLATTLESLAISLRAHGFNALGDAYARGDRLESSLALFLAGYRAGRGE